MKNTEENKRMSEIILTTSYNYFEHKHQLYVRDLFTADILGPFDYVVIKLPEYEIEYGESPKSLVIDGTKTETCG